MSVAGVAAHGQAPWALPPPAGWAEHEGTGAERCWAAGRERGLCCTKAVAGLLDLAGSVSKDSTTFFFFKAFIY